MLRPTLNMDYFHDLYDMAEEFGVGVEGHRELQQPSSTAGVSLQLDTETGPGVFETALAYTEAFRMADNACLFKLVAKSVGMKYDIMPTFMAKPWGDVSLQIPARWISGLTHSFLVVQGEHRHQDFLLRAHVKAHPCIPAGQERSECLCVDQRRSPSWRKERRAIRGDEVPHSGSRVVLSGTGGRSSRWLVVSSLRGLRLIHSDSHDVPHHQLLQEIAGWRGSLGAGYRIICLRISSSFYTDHLTTRNRGIFHPIRSSGSRS